MNFAAIDRSVFRETGLTPAAADEMTLAELAVVCEPEAEPGENVLDEAQALAHLNRLAGMTAEERLWAVGID